KARSRIVFPCEATAGRRRSGSCARDPLPCRPPPGACARPSPRGRPAGGGGFARATPSLAAPPPVHARAYLLEDGQTGQVLAQYRPHARVPIASITKLMTVLLTLEHTKPTDVVTVARGAAAVGESSIE